MDQGRRQPPRLDDEAAIHAMEAACDGRGSTHATTVLGVRLIADRVALLDGDTVIEGLRGARLRAHGGSPSLVPRGSI